jgi:hypothetical protein
MELLKYIERLSPSRGLWITNFSSLQPSTDSPKASKQKENTHLGKKIIDEEGRGIGLQILPLKPLKKKSIVGKTEHEASIRKELHLTRSSNSIEILLNLQYLLQLLPPEH